MATSTKGAQAFPLQWPKGWKRTKAPVTSKFKTSTQPAYKRLLDEIRRLGGSMIVVSTNCPLKVDGVMRMDREPVDAGVAVYFQRKEKGMVFACDTYDLVGHNIHAIGVTIEAMRTIERHGSSELMERSFSGFKQLEADNPGASWWTFLELTPNASIAQIESAYKRLAKMHHPDNAGGDSEVMSALNVARTQALDAAKARS